MHGLFDGFEVCLSEELAGADEDVRIGRRLFPPWGIEATSRHAWGDGIGGF
jgi:hypothetical protein